ncbi:hypothetical protein N9B73_13405, partial [Verrucomicrobiales bacterium]|nr:hypothetical protein [Verrucomicrobiales bacterium]
RRWHITLSEWLRDYLYIPLGGNRKHQDRNLGLTMLLGGLWHGASWNFVIWGAGHGLLLMIERRIPRFLPQNKFFQLIKLLLVFNGVALLWIFFRAPDFGSALDYLEAMFTATKDGERSPSDTLLAILLGFTLYTGFLGKSLTDRRFLEWGIIRQVAICVLTILMIFAFANASLDFIYFVF